MCPVKFKQKGIFPASIFEVAVLDVALRSLMVTGKRATLMVTGR